MQRRESLGLPPGDTDPFFELNPLPDEDLQDSYQVYLHRFRDLIAQHVTSKRSDADRRPGNANVILVNASKC